MSVEILKFSVSGKSPHVAQMTFSVKLAFFVT